MLRLLHVTLFSLNFSFQADLFRYIAISLHRSTSIRMLKILDLMKDGGGWRSAKVILRLYILRNMHAL